jgi:hypothetical protein
MTGHPPNNGERRAGCEEKERRGQRYEPGVVLEVVREK